MVKIHYAASSPELVSITFTSVPGYAGDVPLMTVNVDALQGNKAVTILEATKGEADIVDVYRFLPWFIR